MLHHLAIIGSCPLVPRTVVRVSRFADFQNICGELEAHNYRAGHAACHATMNGFDRVIFSYAKSNDMASLKDAIDRLKNHTPFDILIFPDCTELTMHREMADYVTEAAFDFPFKLLFDAPRNVDIDALVDAQKGLPHFAHYAYPWVNTHTPGRRSQEFLPASCVAGSLVIRLALQLRGVHDLDYWPLQDAEYLAENRIIPLYPSGKMHKVGLYAPAIVPAQPLDPLENILHMPLEKITTTQGDEGIAQERHQTDNATERELMAAIDKRCAEVMAHGPVNNASLWNTLRRCAESVLRPAYEQGKIKRYVVRCDAETAEWGTPDAPVLEILLEFPKRVSQIHVQTTKIER